MRSRSYGKYYKGIPTCSGRCSGWYGNACISAIISTSTCFPMSHRVAALSSNALAQRHGLVEESPVVSRVLGPLATGSPQGLCEADERSDAKMTNKITGCAASHDD